MMPTRRDSSLPRKNLSHGVWGKHIKGLRSRVRLPEPLYELCCVYCLAHSYLIMSVCVTGFGFIMEVGNHHFLETSLGLPLSTHENLEVCLPKVAYFRSHHQTIIPAPYCDHNGLGFSC